MDPQTFVYVQYDDDPEAEASANNPPQEGESSSSSSSATAYNQLRHGTTSGALSYARKKRSCQLCSHVATTEEELAKHVETAHSMHIQVLNAKKQTRDIEAECIYCGIVLSSQALVWDHCRKEHVDYISQEWFICETCHNYFPDQSELILHRNMSHSSQSKPTMKVGECQFCSIKFDTDEELQKHANAAHKDEISKIWHACDRCSLHFPTTILLSRHKVQNHFHQMVNKKSVSQTAVARQKLVQQHRMMHQAILKAKGQAEPPKARPAAKPVSGRAPKPVSGEPMMIQVNDIVTEDGVIIFKQAERAAEQTARGVKAPAPKRQNGHQRTKKAKTSPEEDRTISTDDGFVYIVSDDNGESPSTNAKRGDEAADL